MAATYRLSGPEMHKRLLRQTARREDVPASLATMAAGLARAGDDAETVLVCWWMADKFGSQTDVLIDHPVQTAREWMRVPLTHAWVRRRELEILERNDYQFRWRCPSSLLECVEDGRGVPLRTRRLWQFALLTSGMAWWMDAEEWMDRVARYVPGEGSVMSVVLALCDARVRVLVGNKYQRAPKRIAHCPPMMARPDAGRRKRRREWWRRSA